MEWGNYKKRIIIECKKARKSYDYTEKYIAYAKNLFDHNLPIISSPLHFSLLVGMDHQYVCNMANGTKSFYRSFYIEKKNGGKRKISEPLPDLKFVQKWILKNILEKCEISIYAKAFIKHRTLKTNARFHKNQPILVSLDIKDFFPSISVFMIHDLFVQLGYSDDVSWFLANLCCLNKSLPQGAPTSPYLSNLVLNKFDNDVKQYIAGRPIRYTRYADDLTFSGNLNPHIVIHDISQMLYRYGFKINSRKTHVARRNCRQEVTGIVVNHHMQTSKEKRKQIRQQVYYIKKYGLESHLDYINETRRHFINHLLGQINFALFVNKNDNEMHQYFDFIVKIMNNESELEF